MLDDGIDRLLYWHNDTAVPRLRLHNFIWEAQLIVLKEKLALDDSRAIRPLIVETDVRHVYNRNVPPEQRRLQFQRYITQSSYYLTKMLAVKSVRIINDGAPFDTGLMATFLNQGIYRNMDGVYSPMPRYTPGSKEPYALYYTIEPDINISNRVADTACLNYASDPFNTYAHVIWVRYPAPFAPDNTLELPEEYHYEICLRAAELMNTLDVGETERGQVASANLGQRLTMDKAV